MRKVHSTVFLCLISVVFIVTLTGCEIGMEGPSLFEESFKMRGIKTEIKVEEPGEIIIEFPAKICYEGPDKKPICEVLGEEGIEFPADVDWPDWGSQGRESMVISAFVNNEYRHDITVFSAVNVFNSNKCYADKEQEVYCNYYANMGYLEAGSHTLVLLFNPARSPVKDLKISVNKEGIKPVPSRDEADKLARGFSPIIIGRAGGGRIEPENSYNDVPLGLFYDISGPKERATITYYMVFSNQDGGIGVLPSLMMARYGRTTDIKWIYRVTRDDSGGILEEYHDWQTHQAERFEGHRRGEGDHPILFVASEGNLFSDNIEDIKEIMPDLSEMDTPSLDSINIEDLYAGDFSRLVSTMVFMPIPRRINLSRGHVEEIMNDHPEYYNISYLEMKREGKVEEKAGEDHELTIPGLGDPRDYLYIDFSTEFNQGDLRFKVIYEGEEFFSDHQMPAYQIARTGWNRTSVRLPEKEDGSEYKYEDIESIIAVGDYDPDIVFQKASVFFLKEDFIRQQPRGLLLEDDSVPEMILSEENKELNFIIEEIVQND